MKLAQIEFLHDWREEAHPRYKEIARYIARNVRRREAYQRTFERLVAERCIMTGERVSLRRLPVVSRGPDTPFAQFLGVNQHAKKKIRLIADALRLYDDIGESEFMAVGFETTGYFAFLMDRIEIEDVGRRRRLAETKVEGILRMYEHMRRTGGLVGNAKDATPRRKLRYYDLPWTIDYFGTLKIGDGAHRRAIAAYLGMETLPTLVYRFTDTDRDILSRSNPYLQKNFGWFSKKLRAAFNESGALSSGKSTMTNDPAELQAEISKLADPDHGGRKWYQYVDFGNGVTTHSNGKLRTETFVDFISKFDIRKEDRLLDIGSNAGFFCLLCAPRCAEVIGIEYDAAFHRQALFLKEYFEFTGKDVSNVQLINDDVTRHLDRFSDRTLVFASKVLYHKHLGDGVFRVMEAIQRAPVRAIIVQGHTTQGERGQNDGMKALFAKYGFAYSIAVDHEEYPIGVAVRA